MEHWKAAIPQNFNKARLSFVGVIAMTENKLELLKQLRDRWHNIPDKKRREMMHNLIAGLDEYGHWEVLTSQWSPEVIKQVLDDYE